MIAALAAIVVVVGGGVAAAVVAGSDDVASVSSDRSSTTSTTLPATPSSTSADVGLSDAELVSKLRTAVWRVEATGCDVIGTGSAWAIDDSHLVTNAHVVAHDPYPTVTSVEGQALDATVVGISESPDLAVLRVKTRLTNVLSWSDTKGLQEGEHVVGLGFPVPGTDFSASPGTVVSFVVEGGERVAIRTDAALDHGNSGGPLVTSDGTVAGVITELADNRDGVQVVPLAYTADALADDVDAMIDRPAEFEEDCSWVYGEVEYPELPDYPIVGDEGVAPPVGPYVPPEVPEITTTTVACPTGTPTVRVTAIDATQFDAEYLPGSWDITVRGTIENTASATISISTVELEIEGVPGTSYGFADAFALRPGESTQFEATAYASDWSTRPAKASILDFSWSWDGYEFYDCGTG